jgi:lysophospholipase L1-like esterase
MKRDWWNKEFAKMVTIGASITAGGWSSCRERCWANQLALLINEFQRKPIQLINVGIGANTISKKSPVYPYSSKPSVAERLEKDVIVHCPDLLIIDCGECDAAGGTEIGMFRSEMLNLLERIREKINPLIVMLGMYHMSDLTAFVSPFDHADTRIWHQYDKAIKQMAQKNDCLFVDLLGTYNQADWLVHYDGLHSNDLGHRLCANKIFEMLASNCSGLALETQELEKYIEPWRDESTLQCE